MTPRLTSEVDARYRFVAGQTPAEPPWSRWPVPECPPVPRWVGGPWEENISRRSIDLALTGKLSGVDVPINCAAGRAPWDGSTYGMPITLFDSTGPKTTVWDMSKPVTWVWFTPSFPTMRIPLPEQVRREGDPTGRGSDAHAYLHDPANRVLTEMILVDKVPSVADTDALSGLAAWAWRLRTFGHADWTVGYSGGGPGAVTWDLTKPWNPKTAPRGIVAANIPQSVLFAGWEEIVAGVIHHCLFLVLPDYNPGVTGWARASDGKAAGHPLKGGAVVRLTAAAHRRISALGRAESVIATALRDYGAVLGDKKGVGSNGIGSGNIPLTQDRRWSQGDGEIAALGDMRLRLTDFEVVSQ